MVSIFEWITEGISTIIIVFFVIGFMFAVIPSIAEWLLERIEDLSDFIEDFVDGIGTSNTRRVSSSKIEEEIEKFKMSQERFQVVFQRSTDYADANGDVDFISFLSENMKEYLELVEEYENLIESLKKIGELLDT